MIVHDYQCMTCTNVHEVFINDSRSIPGTVMCPDCGNNARKIPALRRTTPVDAAWIPSVLEVVDKNPNKPHCAEFLRYPTRGNYHKWMAGEGIRPLENGEGPPSLEEQNRQRIRDRTRKREALKRLFQERNAINIATNKQG